MSRPSVKRIAAISIAALAAAWLVGLVVTLRDAADALPTFGGGFDRTGEHIDAVPLGAEAADTAAAEVAGRDDLPRLAPPEQHPGSPANKSAWRCNFGPSSSCKRFRGESVDAAWAAAAEGRIRATLVDTKPLLNETFDVICRETICAINFAFRELPDFRYLHAQTTKIDPAWGETVRGWINEDREPVSFFEIRSWFYDRGHEVRIALIEAGLIQDGSGFFVEDRGLPEIWWWSIFIYRCPTHLLDTCGNSSTGQTVP